MREMPGTVGRVLRSRCPPGQYMSLFTTKEKTNTYHFVQHVLRVYVRSKEDLGRRMSTSQLSAGLSTL